MRCTLCRCRRDSYAISPLFYVFCTDCLYATLWLPYYMNTDKPWRRA